MSLKDQSPWRNRLARPTVNRHIGRLTVQSCPGTIFFFGSLLSIVERYLVYLLSLELSILRMNNIICTLFKICLTCNCMMNWHLGRGYFRRAPSPLAASMHKFQVIQVMGFFHSKDSKVYAQVTCLKLLASCNQHQHEPILSE